MSIKYKIIKQLSKFNGGQATSSTLRRAALSMFGVSVGSWSYGSCFDEAFNSGGRKVSIGRYCSFGPGVRYFGANHPVEECVLSAVFYNREFGKLLVKDVPRSALTIGNDVWIGYGAIITAGCHRIGNGAVIGAGSVVCHDVDPYSVVAGVPARLIRMRFSPDEIGLLEKSRWWELEPPALFKAYPFRTDPKYFVDELSNIEKSGD